jgi:Tfp pilus assembly protein PilF
MRKTFSLVALLTLTLAVSAHAGDARGDSKAQVEFGIVAAQRELWKEADPTYAAAYNNLAIAYEHEGKFEEARKAYEKAVELEPQNQLIQQNYDLFKEINDRTKSRSDR